MLFRLFRSANALCVSRMPAEIFDKDVFVEMSERAHECRIKRSKDTVKLKLRTPGKLVTLKLRPNEAESLIPKLKCPTREA